MSVKHEHEHDDHITSRLQPSQQWVGALSQSHPGLCGTPARPRQGYPRYTGARTREGRWWPDKRAPRDMTKTTTMTRLGDKHFS